MEGGAGATAAIQVLMQNLINVSMEEISRIRGLDVEANKLNDTLKIIQSYLNDAEKKIIKQECVKQWLEGLEKVAFDADNVLDELNYHQLHKNVKAMKTMMSKALSCFSSSFDHALRPHRMALRISKIDNVFESILKKANELKLQRMFEDASDTISVASFATDSFSHDPIFIGRDEDVPKLVEVMTGSPEKMISILAIVGMGGMGKTTLTRKIFHHQKMKTRYGRRSWVYVSRIFKPLIIFKEFLKLLSKNVDDESKDRAGKENNTEATGGKVKNDETETLEDILKKLQEALKAKTYLLVLDDLWNGSHQDWIGFINALSGVTSTKGNGIIITTRRRDVASVVNPLETHYLNGLSEEDCWSIIKAKIGHVIPSEFETIGRKISRRCQGMPLAAMVVGGVLRGKSEQEWVSIQEKWLSDDDKDDISRVLRLSYDSLSSPLLKKCFAYCSIFPKGHQMEKQKLIELWMAEGYLQPHDPKDDMESMGDKFVNVLLSSSLLQVVPRINYYKDEDDIVMNDLVHDLASSLLDSYKLRYMRCGDESRDESRESVRTLFFQGNISKFNLSDFESLHVLHFGNGGDSVRQVLSSSIGKLIHLRKLDISETEIEYLPDSIGELHHLQTLRADTWCMKKLPRTLKYLISLRHLYINDDVKLPPNIGRLTSLRTLSQFTVGHENGCQIEELGKLKNLRGKLNIFNLEKVQGKEEAEKANIFQNPNLFELLFQWNYEEGEGDTNNDENVLEGLQPHPNVKKLDISGFKGKRYPLWTLKMAVRDEPQGSWVGLNKLVEITLWDCSECEEIPSLGHLPNLKHLYVMRLRNVKAIQASFYGINNIGVSQETVIVFPVLERFVLYDMPDLSKWAEEFLRRQGYEVKLYPRLEYIDISSCKKITRFPSYTVTCLKEVNIEDLEELECLPDRLFYDNKNLTKVKISGCPKLTELPEGLLSLNSLEELKIKDCPKLKSIGPNPCGQSQGSLHILCIETCEELMELPHEMVESSAAMLKIVQLKSLRSLKNLPNIVDCLTKSPLLTELSIVGVPKLMATRSVESWPFHSLQRLEIDFSVAIEETVDGILHACSQSLVDLDLTGLENSESLPQSTENLTALSSLRLHNFGIEELPEWFGKLSSLEQLHLDGCKRLKSFGDRDVLGRPTKLKDLKINNCSELRFDSKWLRNKIPHLCITVDDHQIRSCTEMCIDVIHRRLPEAVRQLLVRRRTGAVKWICG